MKIYNFPKAERELAIIEATAHKRRSNLADVKYELPDATRVDAEAGQTASATETQTKETREISEKEGQKKNRTKKKA